MNEQLISDLRQRAASCREFVRQLDAPVLHKAFTQCANLMIAAAEALEKSECNK